MITERQTTGNDLLGRVVVGALLLVYPIGFVGGLLWRLGAAIQATDAEAATVDPSQVNEALMMLFAGGVGSSVYSIRGYLIHSCEKKDFDRAYVPWYVFRTLQGGLLGLIFYFVVRGGLLLITIGEGGDSGADVNTWSLAAIGALVGLFSRYAIEKLREVFVSMFSTKEEIQEATRAADNAASSEGPAAA